MTPDPGPRSSEEERREVTIKRVIDGKFGIDEQYRIVKLSNGEPIPSDEPLFLLRGRDRLAIRTLDFYHDKSQEDGCNDYHFSVLDPAAEAFRKFAQERPERMKQPSITRGR